MNDTLVSIDKAGRIVLPKDVREELAISPGDLLRVAVRGQEVTLIPSHERTGFATRGKALVFSTISGDILSGKTVADVLEGERDQNRRRASGRMAKSKRQS